MVKLRVEATATSRVGVAAPSHGRGLLSLILLARPLDHSIILEIRRSVAISAAGHSGSHRAARPVACLDASGSTLSAPWLPFWNPPRHRFAKRLIGRAKLPTQVRFLEIDDK